MMADDAAGASASDAQQILQEIQKMMGFVPPALGQVARDPTALRAAWLATKSGYLENPLPPLFKEQFMAVMAKYQLAPYSLIVRSCSLRRMGMSPQAILELFECKIPPQALITEKLRVEGAAWTYKGGWVSMPKSLERWVMWGAVRLALRKDPLGRCRNAVFDAVGELSFNKIVNLATFAAMQRVWIDAHPDADPMEDDRVKAQYKKLLEDAPEFARVWDSVLKRAARRAPTGRERKLMAEIGKQDRIRQKLRDSEHRFRQVVRNAAYPVMIYAEDGEVVMLNRAWKSLSGWTRRKVGSVQEWMKRAEVDKADWSPQDLEALEGWEDVIEEGEQRIRTPSGQVRRWDFSTAALGKLNDGRRAYMRMAVDVTEKRDLETALWSTNRHVTNILESITDAFIAIDRDHRLTWMNTRACEMLHWDREAVIGKPIREVVPPDADQGIIDQVLQCMEDGQTRHLEYTSRSMRGIIEAHAYGWPEGVSVHFRDVTERKQAEGRLQVSERRFRALFESGMLGVFWAKRSSGAILDCNDAFLKTVGYTREDLAGGRLNWKELTPPEWHSADQARAKAIVDGPLAPYEKEYFHKDGHRIPIVVGGAPVDHDKDIVMAFVIDRSDEKRAHRRGAELGELIEAVIRSIPNPVFIYDLEGKVLHQNQVATDVFGWTLEESIGKPNPLVPTAMWGLFIDQCIAVAAGQTLSPEDLPCITRSGGVEYACFDAVPVKDRDGHVMAVMGIVRKHSDARQGCRE